MRKIFFLSLTILLIPAFVWAHPGPTDENDCHFCRKNCDVWSVPWNVKHCHGGKVENPVPLKFLDEIRKPAQTPIEEKTTGWEYGMEIKKISAEGPVKTAPEK